MPWTAGCQWVWSVVERHTPEWPVTRTAGVASFVKARDATLNALPSIMLSCFEDSHHVVVVPATVKSMFPSGTLNVSSVQVTPTSADSYSVWHVVRLWTTSH